MLVVIDMKERNLWEFPEPQMRKMVGRKETYIVGHLILESNVLSLEKCFQRLLLLTVDRTGQSPSFRNDGYIDIPVNIAELMLSRPILQRHGDIEGTAGRDSTTNT